MKFLQISDLHFGSNAFSSKRFLEKVPFYIKEHFSDIEYLFITGDLRFAKVISKGFPKETVSFIQMLQEELKIAKENTFLVPGNHDVDRTETRKSLAQYVISNYAPDDGVIDKSILDALDNSMKEFENIYRNICGRKYKAQHFFETRKGVNIISLNSALVCSEDNQDGSLIIGMNLLYEALKKMDKSLPGIVLAHHDFQCFNPLERRRLEVLFKDYNVILYLCGHTHRAFCTNIQEINPKKNLWEYVCGTGMDVVKNKSITDMDIFIGTFYESEKKGYIDAIKWSRENGECIPDLEFSIRQSGTFDMPGRHFFPPEARSQL